ncbi:nucleotide pyrophosphohydrolase [Deinococcus ficus]|uniref:nucleotide pyrophosphohydrolase n=1 Tax=Deinococcus ficus TaxID=317577 RepID=UPI001B7F834C|nr:nucleotide pyrophosphohydrolase [Deinococcus ficus]
MDLQDLQAQLRAFAAERDWDQFHSPKNLAMALSVEVAELVEHFQWLTEEQSRAPADAGIDLSAVEDELADVMLYLLQLSGKLGVDLETAVHRKLQKNARKYPAHEVRGSAAKR